MSEKSAIVAIFDASDQSIASYHQLVKAVESAGAGAPQGRLYHVAYAKNGGYGVVDIWESAESLQKFAETLTPTIQQLGGTPVEPQIYPVVNVIKG